MNQQINLDEKNLIVMKLLHYFITEKNYNPIILQGVEDEIWLENMDEDYKVIRIVSGYIHNDEQFDFDKFKTKRIVRKIKRKTLTFNVNVLSIFLDLGDNVSKEELVSNPNALCIKVNDEEDITNNNEISKVFPDLTKKLKFKEKGVELFNKITTDINRHNEEDARKLEKLFTSKIPYVTCSIIFIDILIYLITILTGTVTDYANYAPAIRTGEYYRLFTSMFLHGNLFHLGFNMYALYIIGSQLEGVMGKAKFLIIYLLSGLSGSLFSMIFIGDGISLGASGAIFGLMGALVYFGWHYRVYLGNVVKTQILPIIALNLLIGFAIPGIDNFAHIGGLIGGSLVTMALGIKDKTTTFERVNGIVVSIIYFAFITYMAFVYSVK
ncbi:MAG: rhomboid family intramembrane serine protease [Bacilli bacterium]|nr:rhomboid family intramembrane serine protease [Bacilli bacterium]